jgi:hypothetical protein
LTDEGFLRAEQQEVGPFPLTLYHSTGKDEESELPPGAAQSLRKNRSRRAKGVSQLAGVAVAGRNHAPRCERWRTTRRWP